MKKVGAIYLSAAALLGLLSTSLPLATSADAASAYVDTAPLQKPVNDSYVEGQSCAGSNFGWAVLGRLKNGNVGFIKCNRSVFVLASELFKIDQKTLKPLVPASVPAKSLFGYAPMVYVTPKRITSKPMTAISSAANFRDLASCRLQEAEYSSRPQMATGFPIPAERAVLDAKLVVQVIPVDFPDVPAQRSPSVDLSDATNAIETFWERQSARGANIEIRVPSSYFRMSKSVTGYNLGASFPNFNGLGYQAYVQEAVKIADSTLDFSGVDVVILAHSPKVKSAQIGTFIAEAGMPGSGFSVKSAEKTILNVMIQGGDQVRDIQNWIHEFGHMLGVTDNGGQSGGSGLGFDVMQWYGNPELTIWNRFILGAALDSQIACIKSSNSSTHWIRPVASNDSNTKGVVIPLSKNKAIVIESRRRLGFDALLGKNSEGALVYVVDTTKSGSEGSAPFKVVGPSRMTILGMWSIDAPLKKGESVTTNGWTISVVESGTFGDVIKVQKG